MLPAGVNVPGDCATAIGLDKYRRRSERAKPDFRGAPIFWRVCFMASPRNETELRLSQRPSGRCKRPAILAWPGFPFWHPAPCQYTSNRLPSILRVRVFLLGSCFCLPKAQFPPVAKTQNRETPYFQHIPQTTLRASPPWSHNFASRLPAASSPWVGDAHAGIGTCVDLAAIGDLVAA